MSPPPISPPAASSSACTAPEIGLQHRARLDHPALEVTRSRTGAATGGQHRAHRNSLSAVEERAGRKDRRCGQGQAYRGRQRRARRIEPPRRARRHRPEARRHARRRAQPAVAPHAGAGVVPGQHARHPRRPAQSCSTCATSSRRSSGSARRSSPAVRSSSWPRRATAPTSCSGSSSRSPISTRW